MSDMMFNLEEELFNLCDKTRRHVIRDLSKEQRLELFETLKQSQRRLPTSYKTETRYRDGLEFVEYPDGVQLEMEWHPFGCWRSIHQVSKDLYNTIVDAANALELELVEWEDLNETPAETYNRGVEEDFEFKH